MIIPAQVLSPVVFGTAGGPQLARHRDRLPSAKALRPAGRCPHGLSLLVIIMDNSGSVTAPGGADPISNRYAETRLAISAVASVCKCRQEYVSLITFDTPHGDIPPSPIRAKLPTIAGLLRAAGGAPGSSRLLPAVTRASTVIDRVGADHVTTVVLSDFALLDDDPGKALAALDALPGTLIACRLGEPTTPGYTGRAIQAEITTKSEPGTLAAILTKAAATYRT